MIVVGMGMGLGTKRYDGLISYAIPSGSFDVYTFTSLDHVCT